MLIKNGKLLQEQFFEYYDLRIRNGRIAEILPYGSRPEEGEEVYDAEGAIVIPGMIDLEVHGAGGYDCSDACDEAYQTISDYLLRRGVTSYVAALDSFPEEILEEACEAAGQWMDEEHENTSRMLGLNLRGPFINPEYAGTQYARYARKPDISLFRRLNRLSGGRIRTVNISPELPGAKDFIRTVSKECPVSLGNSGADFDTARMAYAYGARWCSDLLRNMGELSLTDPGLAGAAMDIAEYSTFCYDTDTIVHPALLRMTGQVFVKRLALVSGQTAFTGLPDGKYEIEDHIVTKRRYDARFEDGRYAGSVSSLDIICMNVMSMGAVPLPVVYKMASETAARALGIFDDVGSITVGKRADLAVLDMHDRHVIQVFLAGKKVL